MNLPFTYNQEFFGGTEYMAQRWHKNIAKDVPKFKNYLSLIIPGIVPPTYELLNVDEEIILWMHNTPQQFGEDKLRILKHPEFIKRVKNIVVASEKQKELTLLEMNVDPDSIIIIPNAIDPLKFNESKFNNIDEIKFIHTSSTDRGFQILLNAINKISENIKVEIYNDFYPDVHPEAPYDPRITFYGKTPKRTVIKALEYSHIHAYPSTYPETFCLSQAEAMSAGLVCVTSNLGALPEISGGFGYMYDFVENEDDHLDIFVEYLNKAINDIKEGRFDPTAQIEYINKSYSWEAIKEKWLEFHETL